MSVTIGVVSGLVATVAMTAVMKAVGDGGPPPTANLVAKFSGGEPGDHKMPGMALHLLYGVGAGAVFVAGAPLAGLGFGSVAVAVGLGLAYGVALMVGGMVFWMRLVIGIEPDKETMKTFAAAHVTYGVVLGASAFVGTGFLA
jgi:hypothetical protein